MDKLQYLLTKLACRHPAPDQGAEIERLRNQLEEEHARGIHSCGPKCNASGCVNRRLREQVRVLSAVLDKANNYLFGSEAWTKEAADALAESMRAALTEVSGE